MRLQITCGQCEKPITSWVQWLDSATQTTHITVECHGAVDHCEAPTFLLDPREIVEARAFRCSDQKQLSVDQRPGVSFRSEEIVWDKPVTNFDDPKITPDNFDQLLADVLSDMNADDAAAVATTQEDDEF